MVGAGTGLVVIDEDMGKLMGELVGNLVPHPAIADTKHDLGLTLGPALVELHGKAVIRLGNQDGLEGPLGVIARNGHGGRIADYYKILRIRLEALVSEPDIKLGYRGWCWVVLGAKSGKSQQTGKDEGM